MTTLHAPPTPATPTGATVVARRTRAERRREQRRRRFQRLLLAGGTAVLLVVALLAVTVLHGRSSRTPATAGTSPAPVTAGVVLLSLRDGNSAPVSALLRADSASGRTAVVLIPAGLIVPVPGLGAMPLGDAVVASRASASSDALRDLLGVTVDATWTLTPDGLAGLVNAVGGVAASVDVDITGQSASGTRAVLVPAGTTHLDGRQAAYVSTWLGDDESEQQRLARFQPVLQHLLEALGSRADLGALLAGLGSSSSSTLGAEPTVALLRTVAAGASAAQASYDVLPTRAIDTGDARATFRVDAEAADVLLRALMGPAVVAADQPRVMVQIASRTAGLAPAARRDLVAADLHYLEGTVVAPVARSLVLIGDSSPVSRARGAAVAAALRLAPSAVAVSARGQTVADVIVVLGGDYRA